MMKISRGVLSLSLALAAGTSHACFVPPAEQRIGVDEQLARATHVALGQAIGATPLGNGVVEYRFLVLEQLAGPAQNVLTVKGGPAVAGEDGTFDNHRDARFWSNGGGRTKYDTDCVIRPSFVVGNAYLLFLGSPPTWRSFEKIEMSGSTVSQDDKWLDYVKTRLAR